MVIVLDNVSIHIDESITQAIEAEGHYIRYLPPYSPDYNLIKLTFSVLKAWIRRHFYFIRSNYENFGDFLKAAIEQSRCDRFTTR